MAQRTLPVLTHPAFPQVFAAAISQEVNRVAFPVPPQIQLSTCCYESPESSWGAADAIACRRVAVVYDVATEMDYCALHYREVRRGR
jgi:hypothetical protein